MTVSGPAAPDRQKQLLIFEDRSLKIDVWRSLSKDQSLKIGFWWSMSDDRFLDVNL